MGAFDRKKCKHYASCLSLIWISLQLCSNASASPFLDVNQYNAEVYRRILSGTKTLTANSVGKKSVVSFRILRDGSVRNLRVSEKSDSAEHDLRALEAVKNCIPFKQIPVDGPDFQDFEIDINYNAVTWQPHCDPVSLNRHMDIFLSTLAHNWHPIRMKSSTSVNITFKVNPQGAIVDATLGQISQSPSPHWEERMAQFFFDEWTLTQAKNCLHGQHLPEGGSIQSIDVLFVYDPGPREVTAQHSNLVGTDCGPCHVDYASGYITLSGDALNLHRTLPPADTKAMSSKADYKTAALSRTQPYLSRMI